ncbi:MAG: hypothetical protein N2652_02910 [Kiritimatiellae bacterium]|nr:hypothetical protein [Kiritimatiellia bacterium]
MEQSAPQWYLRSNVAGAIFGPVAPEVLREWARDGRVGPEDEVSPDGQHWASAPQIAELELQWWMKLPDGRWYGPVHLQAAAALAEEHGLPTDLPVRRGENGVELPLCRALAQQTPSSWQAPPLDERRMLDDLHRALGIRRRD